MKGDISKFLFIDTTLSEGKVNLPARPFQCHGHEQMSLTLINFSMKRNFPLINNYNNTFYLYDTYNLSYHEVTIPGGIYTTFSGSNSLGAAIQTAVAKTVTAAITRSTSSPSVGQPNHISLPNFTDITVAYDAVLKCFTFDPTVRDTSTPLIEPKYGPQNTVEIRCFHLKTNNAAPAGVSKLGATSDVHEILGMKTIFDSAKTFNCAGSILTNTGSAAAPVYTSLLLYGFFPASLSTLDSLYLRCNFDVGNYESSFLDVNKALGTELQHSTILAKIPIDSTDESQASAQRLISFEDTNDTYQSLLPMKSLDHLQFYVTDKRNRKLAAFGKQQEEFGEMHFNLVLRWDKFVGPKEMEHESRYDNQLPPQLMPATRGYGQPRM